MNVIPPIALPNILHASYWESKDLVSAFFAIAHQECNANMEKNLGNYRI